VNGVGDGQSTRNRMVEAVIHWRECDRTATHFPTRPHRNVGLVDNDGDGGVLLVEIVVLQHACVQQEWERRIALEELILLLENAACVCVG